MDLHASGILGTSQCPFADLLLVWCPTRCVPLPVRYEMVYFTPISELEWRRFSNLNTNLFSSSRVSLPVYKR